MTSSTFCPGLAVNFFAVANPFGSIIYDVTYFFGESSIRSIPTLFHVSLTVIGCREGAGLLDSLLDILHCFTRRRPVGWVGSIEMV